jgi:putative acetyltransferase
VEVRDARPEDIVALRALLLDYERSLGIDLCFQSFDEELASLPGDYADERGGALLVAAGVTGCVALRRLDPETCEVKRLYVDPSARGSGLGRALVVAILGRARQLGYQRARLDTLESMQSAQRLYREAGFGQIPPYRPNPVPGATFWELAL